MLSEISMPHMAAVLPGDVGGADAYPAAYIQDFPSILHVA